MAQKKSIIKTIEQRRAMTEKNIDICLFRQCELLNIHRSGLYYKPVVETEENLQMMRMLDEQYFKTPFYGIRRLTAWFNQKGYNVNRKRVKRLMELMGWQTIYHKRNTSKRNKLHAVYPYLLKDLVVNHRNQVWAIDITYIPMRRGFMYLCAIIDLHTRYVVNWGVSNTMSSLWCRQIVEEAIEMHGQPEIINSDQGSQFTASEYISLLTERDNPIAISMDGKGRAIDNIFVERLWKSVKYECVYLHAYEDGVKLYNGLEHYFNFYNNERLHQSLDYKTPESCYRNVA
jgi:putative transposase